jgi:lipoate-protein ligase A
MIGSWRYIPPIEAAGGVQMSIDLYLLEQYQAGLHPPVLRFFTWNPVAISLGYHQHDFPQAWQDLSYQGAKIEIVRRPTGGRAVLHQGDLCYSLITSTLPGSFHEGYVKICEFLQQGWASLGVDLGYGAEGKAYGQRVGCFSSSTTADLVDGEGVKRIGNAQLRRKNSLLQQGSMILSTDSQLYQTVFGQTAPSQLNLDQPKVIESLKRSASNCFQMELVKQSLQDREWEKILSRNN